MYSVFPSQMEIIWLYVTHISYLSYLKASKHVYSTRISL